MIYIELHLHIFPKSTLVNDILASNLGEYGFESFMECSDGLLAYIPAPLFDEKKIKELIQEDFMRCLIKATWETMPDQNWNEEWEKNQFEPIVVGTECIIHSSSQKDIQKVPYDIQIDPKMSFGTGHHETTSMMLGELLKLDVEGKSFLDMGCGTAVLAILACMKGSNRILGIDIDEWAVNNALENIRLNETNQIEIQLGDARLLENQDSFDLIFANIHKNILINDMDSYAAKMHEGSQLFMSGFYQEDIPDITRKAESIGLYFQGQVDKNNWAVVQFKK